LNHPESAHNLSKVFDATILAMASLAEPGEAGNHLLRTQHYVRALARKLQASPAYADLLSEDYIGALFQAAPLHDIGNAGIPDRILLKPGALTNDELDIIKTHPVIGRNTIDQIRQNAGVEMAFLDLARDIVYSHQERWDGSGYPQGIAGDRIPVANIRATRVAFRSRHGRCIHRDTRRISDHRATICRLRGRPPEKNRIHGHGDRGESLIISCPLEQIRSSNGAAHGTEGNGTS
jgi:hypothetical protein